MIRYKIDDLDGEECYMIPKFLFEDQKYKVLTIQEKIVYSLIFTSDGNFTATNKEIGELLGVSKDRGKQIVASLKSKDFIEVTTTRDCNHEITGRIIRVKR
jgi:DNA-binding MarR family transcriptional regulator